MFKLPRYTKRLDLHSRVYAQLTQALQVRTNAAQPRAAKGLGDYDLQLCLGTGRCMFPKQGEEERVCPFCKPVPAGMSDSAAYELARVMVEGN